MPRRHHQRWAMDVIDESVKQSAVAGAAPDSEDKDDEEYDYEDIHVRSSCAQASEGGTDAARAAGAGGAAPPSEPCAGHV
jgi:hypothetical protein